VQQALFQFLQCRQLPLIERRETLRFGGQGAWPTSLTSLPRGDGVSRHRRVNGVCGVISCQ